jgi:uncharacterized protein
MKRVFIIHGWEASPDSNWFPWLKNELEKNCFAVIVPAMPNSAQPKCAEWVDYLKKIVGEVDEDTFFVGHSLGPIAILRFLETLSADEKAGGVIMVAGFSESLGIPEIESFFQKPLDYEKIKRSVRNIPTPSRAARATPPERGIITSGFVAINSDDDPYVPMSQGKILEKELGAELIVMHNCGHLNAGTGFFELPIVLEKILAMAA